jgi:hypothetical protein
MSQHQVARRSTAGDQAYTTEHSLAYVMAVVALVLGVIGVLRGFGVIGGSDASNTPNGNVSALWDGVMWLLPAISAAFLAWALHTNDHHRMRDTAQLPDADEGMWKGEHAAAYLSAAASVVFALLGMLVGFHLLGRGDHQYDSIPWHLASIGMAVLTNALHSVRHHQLATDDDFVATRRVEGTPAANGVSGTPRVVERPSVRR